MKNENDQWNRPPDQGVGQRLPCSQSVMLTKCRHFVSTKMELRQLMIIIHGLNTPMELFQINTMEISCPVQKNSRILHIGKKTDISIK